MKEGSTQIALPLSAAWRGARRIVLGEANAHVARALADPSSWPFRTAVLTGPPRSGKSLFARWFATSGRGVALDDAATMDETALFHRWNRTQEEGTALLLVGGEAPWRVALPDLASRLGAALQLEIGQAPDDIMAAELMAALAEQRGLPLGEGAAAYLVPRMGRSFEQIERIVSEIDRLSLERKAPATHSIWRAALDAVVGPDEPRLL